MMNWIAWLLVIGPSLVDHLLRTTASICEEQDKHCRSEESIPNKALRGFTYRTLENKQLHECYQECDADLICQSFNYVMLNHKCELNNRTREGKPGNLIADSRRFYVTRIPNRDKVHGKKNLIHR